MSECFYGIINNPKTDSKEVIVKTISDSLIDHFAIPDIKVAISDLSYITFDFKYNKEQRSLGLHFNCDNDYNTRGLDGRNIIFSLTAWGSAEQIIKTLLKDLQAVIGGTAYYEDEHDQEVIKL